MWKMYFYILIMSQNKCGFKLFYIDQQKLINKLKNDSFIKLNYY